MLMRERLASLTAATALVAGAMVLAPAANAAERNYEVVVCNEDGSFNGGTANVGGYNQYNQFVHTPNFPIRWDCGYQVHWWFKPNQTVEINARKFHGTKWYRFYRNLSSCRANTASHRICLIP
ncbi:hypothetical protein ABT186_37975 [Streptomyces sp. NPDC001634]|uniref:hypothetical protein n=1 Tax=Streptomyces sp. NPDC001634 TaxID=3154390 RepID=UPI00332F51B2